MTLSEKIISVAVSYDGIREKPKNQGFHDQNFEKKMKSVGWYQGAPWCAFFVKLVWLEAIEAMLTKKHKLYIAVRTQFNGSAKGTFDAVKKAGIIETGTSLEVGAAMYFILGNGPSGHVGINRKIIPDQNTVYNVEGNTNAAGSREGEYVNTMKPRTIKRDFAEKGLNFYGCIYPRLIGG